MNKKTIENKCFLVTGGAGFIGSHLCEKLLSMGAKVVCVDNLSAGRIQNLEECINNLNFVFIEADCNDFEEMNSIFHKYPIQYVFHYAATVGVLRTQENPINVLRDIDGIKNLLDLSRKHRIKKFIYASSSEIYGEQLTEELREEDDPKVKMPYAVVKIVGETYCKTYWEKYGLDTTSLRFFNVYGPRQDGSGYGFVVSIFINQAIEEKDLTVFNDGKMTRSFVFIKDNIDGAIAALLATKSAGQCVNIGTGNFLTIFNLAEKIISISGSKKIRPVLIKNKRPGEIRNRKPSLKKMHKLLKFKAKYDLNKGLKDTFEYFINNKAKTLAEDDLQTLGKNI